MLLTALLTVAQIGPSPSAPTREESFASEVIALTNRERSKEGLPILLRNDKLTDAARFLADDLSGRRALEHFDKHGRPMQERYEAAGYLDWRSLAENVAVGQKSPDAVVKSWMKSQGHRENILDSSLAEIGVGVKVDGKGRITWVQSFGSRF
jgi:uncharacterized protein YkwD